MLPALHHTHTHTQLHRVFVHASLMAARGGFDYTLAFLNGSALDIVSGATSAVVVHQQPPFTPRGPLAQALDVHVSCGQWANSVGSRLATRTNHCASVSLCPRQSRGQSERERAHWNTSCAH